MRVRIKRAYMYNDMWEVQIKYWWSPWITKRYLSGDRTEAQAIDNAREIFNETAIREVK